MAIFTGTAAAATALAAKLGIGAKLASAFGAAKGLAGTSGVVKAAGGLGTRMAGGNRSRTARCSTYGWRCNV